MQIHMTIATKRSQIPRLVSECRILQGRDLMMNFESSRSPAICASPAIPIQHFPPDPLPAISREILPPLHPTIDDS